MSFEVKICGITNVEDATAALECGADYLGFVFYPPSPRAVTVAQAQAVLRELSRPCRAVGVFVNGGRDEVEAIAGGCGLWAVQLHGDEASAEFAGTPLRVWRALKVEASAVTPDPDEWSAERYVVDASVPGAYGGTGVTADWEEAGKVARRYPVLLAGGLTPVNVAAAVRKVAPCGVDVSSGVELRPGKKDIQKMLAFVKRVREVVVGGCGT